jgi:WD40 repeat protein
LWCFFFLAILLMAGVEGLVLWFQGARYEPRSSFHRVWATDISLDEKGHWAALQVTFRRNSKQEGISNDIVLIDLRQDEAIRLAVPNLQPSHVAIAPTGDALAIACADGSIHTASGMTSDSAGDTLARARLFARPSDRALQRVVFSPNGRLLAAISEDFFTIWRWPDGSLLHRWSHNSKTLRTLAFSADSQRIYSVVKDRELSGWDVNSGEIIETHALPKGTTSVDFSPDFRLIAVRTSPGRSISVHRLGVDDELWHKDWSFPAIAFDQQGRRIATVFSKQGRIGIDVHDAETGQQLCRLYGHDTGVIGLTFASDGFLYSWDSGGSIRSWNVDRARERWLLAPLQWVPHRN